MKNNLNKIIVILVIISLASFVFSLIFPKSPILVSTYPTNGANLSDLRSSIVLEFNQNTNLGDLKLEIAPNDSFVPSQLEDKKIILVFDKALKINSTYSLLIFYKDKQIGELQFTTNVPPNTQYDARFNQDKQSELNEQYPLIAKTPYETTAFRVVYSAPLTLQISLKDGALSQDSAVSLVQSWVKNNGSDPSTHKYVFSD